MTLLFTFFASMAVGQTSCSVGGVTISATGTTTSVYLSPTSNPDGCTATPFSGSGIWTGNTAAGNITFTFSQPVTSARVSYTAVNTADILEFSTNTGGSLTLSDACNANILSPIRIQGVANYTDSWITVTSTIPFTSLIGTNVGASSGWVQGDICDFQVTTCDLSNPSLDCDGDGFQNGVDCEPSDPFKGLDTDQDGICDVDDLDADNDGILNSVEGCATTPVDISGLTFNGTVVGSTTANSITTAGSSWRSSYSDQTFSLPIRLEFSTNTGFASMFGLLPVGGTQNTGTWNDGAYKVYFATNSFYGKLPGTWDPSNITRNSTDVFVLEIDTSGALTLTQNGTLRFSGTAPVSNYQLAISKGSNTTISNIVLTHGGSFTCADTDMDGIADYLDLDSDNDGCPDAIEGTANFTSADIDGNNMLLGGVDGNGIPVIASPSGQDIGFSRNTTAEVCTDSDADGVADFFDIDDDNDGVLDQQECNALVFNIVASTFSGTLLNDDLVLDIFRIDNSFNLTINGNDVAGEIQFHRPTGGNIATFGDGSAFGENGIPDIWTMRGNEGNPVIRVVINQSGQFEIFGSRTSYGPLEPMVLSTPAASISWNSPGSNSIVIAQELIGPTRMNGVAYSTGCDIDGDGLPNFLDLDADNDSCSDANEAYNDANADGGDDMVYGSGTPAVNPDGTVVAAAYPAPADMDTNGTPEFQEVGAAPTITVGPANSHTFVNTNDTFSSTDDGDTHQWQVSTDGGTNFTDIADGPEYSGTTTNTLTVIAPEVDKNGFQYRVVISSDTFICGNTVSAPATLTVGPRTIITNRRITFRVNKN